MNNKNCFNKIEFYSSQFFSLHFRGKKIIKEIASSYGFSFGSRRLLEKFSMDISTHPVHFTLEEGVAEERGWQMCIVTKQEISLLPTDPSRYLIFPETFPRKVERPEWNQLSTILGVQKCFLVWAGTFESELNLVGGRWWR